MYRFRITAGASVQVNRIKRPFGETVQSHLFAYARYSTNVMLPCKQTMHPHLYGIMWDQRRPKVSHSAHM